MNSIYFSAENRLLTNIIRGNALRDLLIASAHTLLLVLLVSMLVAVVGIELNFLMEAFSYLRPPMPGEDAGVFGVFLISLVGMVVLVTVHLHVRRHPDSPVIHTFRIICVISIVAYAVGAGGLFAAGIWADGLDVLFGQGDLLDLAAQLQGTISDAAAAKESGWVKTLLEKQLFPVLAVSFILGMIGFTPCVIYVAHLLLNAIEAQLVHVWKLTDAARRLTAAKRLTALDSQMLALAHEDELLTYQIEGAEARTAALVQDEISRAIFAAEKMLNSRHLHMTAGNGNLLQFRFKDRLVTLDAEGLKELVSRMQQYDTAAVLRALRTGRNEVSE